jgi:peptidase M28-like protein
MPLLDAEELRSRVSRLAAIERPSASPGERRAAETIVEELRSVGVEARIEEERAHGTYWLPVGLLTGLAAVAGLSRRRAAAIAAAFSAAGVADDVSGGSHWFRRRFLPQRNTSNVVAEFGSAEADRTALFVAHHDAAHSGLVFHPELPRSVGRRFPRLLERSNTTPPVMWGAVAGPLLVALGALTRYRPLRLLGSVISAGYTAAMADIGLRRVVPGANDNASGVAVLLSLAHWLREERPSSGRVILLFTGSEESFMEGMRAFAQRHFSSLPRESTYMVCVDTVGSPHLLLLEGEGMLKMNEYPKDFLGLIKGCAKDLGIYIYPNLRLRNATDGLIPLRRRYPTATIGSVDKYKAPTNYHWPTDVPDRVDYGSVGDAARLCQEVARRLVLDGTPREPATPPTRAQYEDHGADAPSTKVSG